jgi:tetratricopeptide (TPR) repeat protein
VAFAEPDLPQQAAARDSIEATIKAGVPTDSKLAAERAFSAAWRTSDMDQRIRLFSEAIDLEPSYVAAYFERGNIYRDKSNLRQALADYDRAIDHHKQDPLYHAARGKLRKSLGNSSAAQEDFNSAVRFYAVEIENAPHEPFFYLERKHSHEWGPRLPGGYCLWAS